MVSFVPVQNVKVTAKQNIKAKNKTTMSAKSMAEEMTITTNTAGCYVRPVNTLLSRPPRLRPSETLQELEHVPVCSGRKHAAHTVRNDTEL